MGILVEKFAIGPLETNAYLIIDDARKCLLVDPSSGCEQILKKIKNDSLELEAIILTHGHFDHIMGIPEIRNVYPEIPVFVHPQERVLLDNPEFNGSFMIGEKVKITENICELNEGKSDIGSFSVEVFLVAGHSPGGIAIKIDNLLFCGDILFAGSVGRTDLLGGNEQSLIDGIQKKLMTLPEDTIVCPGHGGRTTIGREKRMNPYL